MNRIPRKTHLCMMGLNGPGPSPGFVGVLAPARAGRRAALLSMLTAAYANSQPRRADRATGPVASVDGPRSVAHARETFSLRHETIGTERDCEPDLFQRRPRRLKRFGLFLAVGCLTHLPDKGGSDGYS